MPIHSGKDNQGSFYQWGKTGKKYYYESSNEESRKRAYKKAEQQQTAIYSSGYKGDSEMKKPTMKLVRIKRNDEDVFNSILKHLEEGARGISLARNNILYSGISGISDKEKKLYQILVTIDNIASFMRQKQKGQ